MFTLAESMWMFSAAGIIVPVIIHFWNRKQGKTLKVGSISLLTESYKQQAKNIQLQERLLLLLRSLIILLLAFFISGPNWIKQLDPGKQKGWILMEKYNLAETYSKFKPVVDSLVAEKYEFHYFDAAFEKAELAMELEIKADSLTPDSYSYWNLLSSLDQQVPARLPVYVFTTNGLQKFSGKRPEVAMNLQWYTYTPKDSVSEYLAKAYMTARDSVRLVTATSKPSGISYSYINAPFTGISLPRNAENNTPVSYQSREEVTVDTATLKITIYTEKFFKDAAYVKAAIEAIRQFNRRKISLSVVNKSAAIVPGQDWLFWLSDQPMNASGAKNIFKYESGKSENRASFIQAVSLANGDEYLPLNKRIAYNPGSQNAKAIWQDGFGTPLLSVEPGEVSTYHFYSRFDPSWNDLAWHEAFPRLIFSLIYHEDADASDNRVMDDQQALPVFNSAPKATEKEKFTEKLDLSQAFWLAAFLLFCIERFISFRKKTNKTNA